MRARHFILLSLLLLSLSIAASALGVCANIVAVNAALGDSNADDGPTAGVVFITLDATADCGQTIPTINVGDGVAITSGGKQFEASVKEVIPSAGLFTRIEAMAAGPVAEDADTLDQLTTNAAATVKIGTESFDAKIINANLPLLNITRYEWSIGPATKATTDNSGGTGAADGDESAEGAFRFQYDGEYARPGFLGRGSSASKFQTIGTLSIDTTNSEDPGYIDNNQLAVGIRSIELPMSSLLAQARVGVEGSLTRSFHQDAQDGDVMATFSTWIPALRSKTFFSSIPDYISPPLAISLSYGYRNKQVPGAKTISGRSGEATATYYLYAFDDYQLTLSGTWTLNDMSDRPATMKRTSRLYRIGVAHMTDPAKGFEVVTSFEDGSIGPLLTKVRQYYIGIATKKFSLSGGSK